MANPKQPERWEAIILAALMCVAGSLFFFGKLESLMRSGILSWHGVLHAAPVFLAVMGVSLLLADRGASAAYPSANGSKERRYE